MEIVLYKKNKDFKWVVSKDNFLSQSECETYIEKIKNSEELIKDKDFTAKQICVDKNIKIHYNKRQHSFSTTNLRKRIKESE